MEGLYAVKWDNETARSRGGENREPTDYLRYTMFDVLGGPEGEFGNLIGTRGLMWIEGEIDADDFKGKVMEVDADLRDQVQVIGSTQVSLTLSNVQLVKLIEGEEAKAAKLLLARAQNNNLKARGPRQVTRSATTGTVTAASEAGALLDAALAEPGDALKAAQAILGSDELSDAAKAGLGELMLHSVTHTHFAAAPTAIPVGEVLEPGDRLTQHTDGTVHAHQGVTTYRHEEGVERKPVAVQPQWGVIGGADVASAPGQELSPRDLPPAPQP